MGFDLFRRDRKSSSSSNLSVSRVHVYTGTDRPILDLQFSKALKDSLHDALLQSFPECNTLWRSSVEKDKVAINERPVLLLVTAPQPLSIHDLTEYVQYQTVRFLENELHYSMSGQKGRLFMVGCYHDPKATTNPDPNKLVKPWSMGSSEPNDRVDPVIMAQVVFFEE
jgi:hypothetical protein